VAVDGSGMEAHVCYYCWTGLSTDKLPYECTCSTPEIVYMCDRCHGLHSKATCGRCWAEVLKEKCYRCMSLKARRERPYGRFCKRCSKHLQMASDTSTGHSCYYCFRALPSDWAPYACSCGTPASPSPVFMCERCHGLQSEAKCSKCWVRVWEEKCWRCGSKEAQKHHEYGRFCAECAGVLNTGQSTEELAAEAAAFLDACRADTSLLGRTGEEPALQLRALRTHSSLYV